MQRLSPGLRPPLYRHALLKRTRPTSDSSGKDLPAPPVLSYAVSSGRCHRSDPDTVIYESQLPQPPGDGSPVEAIHVAERSQDDARSVALSKSRLKEFIDEVEDIVRETRATLDAPESRGGGVAPTCASHGGDGLDLQIWPAEIRQDEFLPAADQLDAPSLQGRDLTSTTYQQGSLPKQTSHIPAQGRSLTTRFDAPTAQSREVHKPQSPMRFPIEGLRSEPFDDGSQARVPSELGAPEEVIFHGGQGLSSTIRSTSAPRFTETSLGGHGPPAESALPIHEKHNAMSKFQGASHGDSPNMVHEGQDAILEVQGHGTKPFPITPDGGNAHWGHKMLVQPQGIITHDLSAHEGHPRIEKVQSYFRQRPAEEEVGETLNHEGLPTLTANPDDY